MCRVCQLIHPSTASDYADSSVTLSFHCDMSDYKQMYLNTMPGYYFQFVFTLTDTSNLVHGLIYTLAGMTDLITVAPSQSLVMAYVHID